MVPVNQSRNKFTEAARQQQRRSKAGSRDEPVRGTQKDSLNKLILPPAIRTMSSNKGSTKNIMRRADEINMQGHLAWDKVCEPPASRTLSNKQSFTKNAEIIADDIKYKAAIDSASVLGIIPLPPRGEAGIDALKQIPKPKQIEPPRDSRVTIGSAISALSKGNEPSQGQWNKLLGAYKYNAGTSTESVNKNKSAKFFARM